MYEIVCLGSGNVNSFHLKLDGVVQSLASETRFTLHAGGVTLDSDIDSELFDWVTDPDVLAVEFGSMAVEPGVHSLEIRSYNPIISPYFCWGMLPVTFK